MKHWKKLLFCYYFCCRANIWWRYKGWHGFRQNFKKSLCLVSVIWIILSGSLCFVFVRRQPFPAGDRVTFNGKECICQKCTLPLPANSPAPIQAVHSQYFIKSPTPCTMNHTSCKPKKKKIILQALPLSEIVFSRLSLTKLKCAIWQKASALVASSLLSSGQIAAAVGRSSRTSSPL